MNKTKKTNKPAEKLFGLSAEEYEKISELLGREPDDFELGIFSAML